MTNEQIIELAKQAGFWEPMGLPSDWEDGDYVVSPQELQRFAELVLAEAECGSGAGCLYKEAQIAALEEKLALVRNAALEDAAKACDEREKYWCKGSDSAREAASCATVIRSMKS